jgi:hypothetical protein
MRKKTRKQLTNTINHLDTVVNLSDKNFGTLDEQVGAIMKMIVDVVDELDVIGERLTQLEGGRNTTDAVPSGWTRLIIDLPPDELEDLKIASDLHDMDVEDFVMTVIDEAVASVVEADHMTEWGHEYEVSKGNHPSAKSKDELNAWLESQAEAKWKMRRNGEANSYEAVIKYLNGDK